MATSKFSELYQQMIHRYDESGPPEFTDTELLSFMLLTNVEFNTYDQGVVARTFLPKWTPYGSGHTKREALSALVANAAAEELHDAALALK